MLRVRQADGPVAVQRHLVARDQVLRREALLDRAQRPLDLVPGEQVAGEVAAGVEARIAGLRERGHRDVIGEQGVEGIPVLVVIASVNARAGLDDLEPVRDGGKISHG